MSGVRQIKIISIVFQLQNDPKSDFKVMIKNLDYKKNSLFLFNDNVRHHKTNEVGGGNAVIRPYNKYGNLKINNRPLSAGIVTGWFGQSTGFENLEDPFVKNTIHENINEIYEILREYPEITQVFYSTNQPTKDDDCTCTLSNQKKVARLGNGTFLVDPDVLCYITQKLYDCVDAINTQDENFFLTYEMTPLMCTYFGLQLLFLMIELILIIITVLMLIFVHRRLTTKTLIFNWILIVILVFIFLYINYTFFNHVRIDVLPYSVPSDFISQRQRHLMFQLILLLILIIIIMYIHSF